MFDLAKDILKFIKIEDDIFKPKIIDVINYKTSRLKISFPIPMSRQKYSKLYKNNRIYIKPKKNIDVMYTKQ